MPRNHNYLTDNERQNRSENKLPIDEGLAVGGPVPEELTYAALEAFQNQYAVEYNDSNSTLVRLINTTLYDGNYVVVSISDPSKAYLVPSEYLKGHLNEQRVGKDVIAAASVPYNWDKEIETLMVSKDEVRTALYWAGELVQRDVSIRELIAKLLQRGVLPIRKIGD